MIKPLAITAGLLVAGGLLVAAFLQRRSEHGRSGETEAAVVGESRVREMESETAVVLDSATLRRMALVTAPAGRGQGWDVPLAGVLVPDPQGVATVRAPVAGRLTAIREGSWPAFGQQVAAGSPLAQVSDARPLTVPRSGTVTRVSAQPGELVQAGQELLEISDFSRPLARIAWREEAPRDPPAALMLAPVDAPHARVPAHLIGAAPEVDPLTRRPAFLYRAQREWAGARPGAPVLAFVPDPHGSLGAFVPGEAVVQWDALAWVFIQRGPGRYVRTRISTARPVPGGWLVTEITGRDTLVVRGAEQLLSEEFRARIVVGEEVGE